MIEQHFQQAIAAAGLTPPDDVIGDGRLHRFSSNGKPRNKNGWYVLHLDGVAAGSFGDWSTGLEQKWCSKSADTMSESERQAHRERTKAMQAARDADKAQRQRQASEVATSRLNKSTHATDDHPYLQRKGAQAHGIRAEGGNLLVPMRDTSGKLHSLQVIDAQGEKRFLPGGRVSGCFYGMGKPDGVLIVVEGFATGASLHESTGHAVAVAFNAGNLKAVAVDLQAKYPALKLIIAADDDHRTDGNPGLTKATEAAQAVGGLLVVPDFGADRPDGATDFNDLHAHHGGAAGLAVVRAQVQAAIAAATPAENPATAAPEAPGKRATKQRPSKRQADSEALAQHSENREEWDGFSLTDNGVFYSGLDRDGKRTSPQWVCSPLRVEAATHDVAGENWGYLLTFTDQAGREKRWPMPARMLAGDGNEFRGILLGMGLCLSSNQRMRHLLAQYIQSRKPTEFATCTDKIGWHGRAFVLPGETLGNTEERVIFQSDAAMENTHRQRGTLDAWIDRVAAMCSSNSRLTFAVAAAFAGPLLRPAGMESGGFHFRGDSSSGKTTALRVACSVYGGTNFLQRWRTTSNALESTAAQHSDTVLCLDELAQIEPREAGEAAYLLGNETSKARASRSGQARARLTWRLLFLSAGEIGLADHMQEGMKRMRTGQEVRLCDVPADAGAGMGAFEDIHGAEGPAAFSRDLSNQCGAVYGTAGRAWLEWLTQNTDTLKPRIKEAAAALAAQLIPESSAGQVHRVGERFALVGAAGELATEAGLTGWQPGESEAAARSCFNSWLAARGGIGNGEVQAMLRQVRRFLEAHGQGRFVLWHRANDDHAGKTLHRAGFARLVNEKGEPTKIATKPDYGGEWSGRVIEQDVRTEYFILAEVFRGEVCQGFDPVAVCKVLLDHGCLMPDKGRSYDCKPRLPGVGPTRCYRVLPQIFDTEE